MITTNTLIAFEIFHDMYMRTRPNEGISLKLDIVKAYDKVEWPFLRTIMIVGIPYRLG